MRKPMPFGKYLLLDRIAVGGMAEVFAAKSFGVEGFERVVAIKRILPTMVEDDEFISMFIDEARIASMLNHANIVQIYELGKHDDTFFIAMEYVSGRDVRMLIDKYKKRGQAMPVDLACYIVAKVAEGLDYAHRKKDQSGRDLSIIHRDISPQNVLVSYEGEVKIIDLGIAKAAGRLQKTQAGILKGKFGYMSPEQVRGIPIDHRSDIYSAGVMLYEMLTGTKLFTGESDFSTLEKVRAGEVRPPSELNPAIVPALEAVVLKALAKDRDQRYQWAGELSDALLHHLFSSSSSVFSNSKLAGFMRDTFSDELRKEGERIRRWSETAPDENADPHALPPQQLSAATSTGPDGRVRIGPPSAFMTAELRLQDRTNVVGTPFNEEAPAPRGYGARRPPPPVNDAAVTEAASLADLGMAFAAEPAADVADRPTQVKAAPEPPPRKNSKIQKGLKSQPPASPGAPPPFSGDETMPPDFVDIAILNAAAARPAPAPEPVDDEPVQRLDLAHPKPSRTPLLLSLVAVLAVLGLAAFLFSDELARLGGPSSGSLLVSVTPAKGLEIFIDGSLVGTASPASARLPYGKHTVEVKAEGFRPWTGEVDVAKKSVAMPAIELEAIAPPPPPPEPEPEPEPVVAPTRDTKRNRNSRTTTPPPPPAPTTTRSTKTVAATKPPPEPEETTGTGALMVFSSPKGARLFVDGRARGQTPLKIAELPTSRDVELRLELDGYKTQSRAERASDGTPRMVKFELQAEAAAAPAVAPTKPIAAPADAGSLVRVIGLCRPASQVHVDGRDTGRSSPIFPQKALELSAGRHVIACVNADGRRKEQVIELVAGQAPFKFDITLGD